MNRAQRKMLAAMLHDEQTRLNVVAGLILDGETEHAYRTITTTYFEIRKVRLKLYNQLHPSVRETVLKL